MQGSIDWVWHCTCHLEMQNPSIFKSVNIPPQSCTTARKSLFYGESTIYKVWRLSINLLLKNEVSLVILQRNENHPTSNFFEIRKPSLISRELSKPEMHALPIECCKYTVILDFTQPFYGAWYNCKFELNSACVYTHTYVHTHMYVCIYHAFIFMSNSLSLHPKI